MSTQQGTSRFVYCIYIRTTPEKLWEALTSSDLTKKYWWDTAQDCTWEKGAPWKIMLPDGRVADSGEVLEIDPPRKLVLKWRNEFKPELHEEGYSRMTYLLEPEGSNVKLTLTHEMDRPDSKLISAVSNGWPEILSSLKSLLETGEALEST